MTDERHPHDLKGLDPERFVRLERALERVLDLPVDEAHRALDGLLEGDPELHKLAQAILAADRRLASRGTTGAFLSRPVLEEMASSGVTPANEPDEANLIGSHAGPYRIVREIGRGGMGRVYLAERDDGQFQQTVAIKVLKRGLDTDEMLRRFLRERQILARLEHRNIARLLDGGATPDGRPFLAMERVEGIPITAWCDARQSTLDQRIDLFLAVCGAVQHAHRHLVVHRDLKPANVLVTSDGEPKLLDFGIAHLLAGEDDRITRLEGLPLTPAYAAPEQFRGEPATTGTDVYGLGMVLYELMAGRHPFSRAGGSREPRSDPDPPSRVSGRRALAGDLDAIALTALAPDPSRRYGSVEELARDLRRYRAHLPVLARRPGRLYRLRKLVRRHAAAVTAGVTLFVLLGAYAATTAVMLERQRRERARAETAARRAERIQLFLTDMLARAGPARLGEGTEQHGDLNPDATVRDVLDRAAERAQRELAEDPPVFAAVEHVIADTYMALGLYDRAEPHARSALRIREGLGDPDALISSLVLLSQIQQRRTRYAEAEVAAHRGSEIARRVHGEQSVDLAMTLQNEQSILASLGRGAEASEVLAQAVRIGRAGLQPNDPRLLELLSSSAIDLGRQGRYESADSLHREVLANARRIYGPEHPRTVIAMSNFASSLSSLHRFAEAESLEREVLVLRRRTLGPEHPAVATTLANLGFCLREEGKLVEAEAALREALAIQNRILGPESRETLSTQSILANLLLREGKAKEAEQVHRSVLATRRRVFGPEHPLVATSLVSLSDALIAQGRTREALPLLRDAVALRERVLPAGHPDIAKAKTKLAAAEHPASRPVAKAVATPTP
ncbi:MAG TPA: serine/threonine-protein kinase [Candidatus Eisenbacteria bacterium]|nr:serine/threonine-protein kinase [Candidatus Eisenbacteria bacterium]